jgi:hypothetical protein
VDEWLRKLEQFDDIYLAEMSAAMQEATAVAAEQAQKNAPKLTGALAGSIYNQLMAPLKKTTVRGFIGLPKDVKAKVQEYGRWYGRGATNHKYWKGRFYLWFAPKDKSAEISALYNAANERIVKRLDWRANG